MITITADIEIGLAGQAAATITAKIECESDGHVSALYVEQATDDGPEWVEVGYRPDLPLLERALATEILKWTRTVDFGRRWREAKAEWRDGAEDRRADLVHEQRY